MSKTTSIIAGIVTTAVLTVPFLYEKDEKGGVKARAVIYDLNVSTDEEGKRNVKLDFGGILKDQVKTVAKIIGEYNSKRAVKKQTDDIDADFDLVFTEEDEDNFDIELTTA